MSEEVRDLPGQAHDHPTGEFCGAEAVSIRGAKDPKERRERSVGPDKPRILHFQPQAPILASLTLYCPKNQATWACCPQAEALPQASVRQGSTSHDGKREGWFILALLFPGSAIDMLLSLLLPRVSL